MTANQFAFICCRVLAVVAFLKCLAQALAVVSVAGAWMAGVLQPGMRASAIQAAVVAVVFGILTVALWFKADSLSRMLLPKSDSEPGLRLSGQIVAASVFFATGALIVSQGLPGAVSEAWKFTRGTDAAAQSQALYLMIARILQIAIGAGMAFTSVSALRRG